MYKKTILDKQYTDVTEYMQAWSSLQTAYFNRVSGHYKYEEWSKFSM